MFALSYSNRRSVSLLTDRKAKLCPGSDCLCVPTVVASDHLAMEHNTLSIALKQFAPMLFSTQVDNQDLHYIVTPISQLEVTRRHPVADETGDPQYRVINQFNSTSNEDH